MPFTTADVDKHKKGLSDKQKRQWVHIANGCLADGKYDEGRCIRMANGVAGKEFTPQSPPTIEEAELLWEVKDYQYVDSYEYSEKRLPQSYANYNPVGGTSAEACANCQFFIAPSRCSVVDGTISPTGHSDMWHAVVPYSQSPIPVTIVGGSAEAAPAGVAALDKAIAATIQQKVTSAAKNFGVELEVPPETSPHVAANGNGNGNGILSRLKGLVTGNTGSASPPPVQGSRAFSIAKQKDGRTRFYVVWSNNFKDREGEIFTKAAHKEFVDWASSEGQYPELWIWHTSGTEFGQVDWLDATDDGFVHASGLIHAGKEALAEQLASQEVGVSHGFFGLQQANLIHWYRSYELSVLPLKNAAVWTTSFNILNAGKATEMAFTAEKRKFFNDLGFDEAQIKEWEAKTDGLADALKGIGLESKAADLGVDTPPPPSAEQVLESDFRKETTKALMAIQETMGTLADQVKEIKEKTKDIKSGDAVVAAAMAPAAAPAVTQASKANDNVVESRGTDSEAAREFFSGTILGSLIGNTNGAAG